MTANFHEPNHPAGPPEGKTRVGLSGADDTDMANSTSSPEPANTAASRADMRLWRDLGDKLESVLSRLKEDECLVLCVKGTNHFVQFMNQGAAGLRAEAVSNGFLSDRERWSDAQHAAFLALGWEPPTGSPEEATPIKQPEGSANYLREFEVPVDAAAAAFLAVVTLADVMAIPHPGFLSYQSFDVDQGGSLAWSELGLKVAEPAQNAARTAEQLLRTLREETGLETLDFDEDGDIPLCYGSVLVFARVSGDMPSVRLHARILGEVRSSPALLDRLNELNARVVRPAFFHASDNVYAITDIPATPFEGRHVARALREFCELADGVDELLQSEFGGHTTFADGMPSTKLH